MLIALVIASTAVPTINSPIGKMLTELATYYNIAGSCNQFVRQEDRKEFELAKWTPDVRAILAQAIANGVSEPADSAEACQGALDDTKVAYQRAEKVWLDAHGLPFNPLLVTNEAAAHKVAK